MTKWLAPICACLVLGLVAVGCGGDDEDSSSGSADTAATTEQLTQTEESAATEKSGATGSTAVEIVDIDYDPNEIAVAKGTTVKWTNTGKLPHTVTKEEGPGKDFDSGTLQPGDTYEETFTDPGEISYHCTIHQQQRGSVTVE